jgi:hypothetical protein
MKRIYQLSSLSLLAVALPAPALAAELFLTSDNCQACHNVLATAQGEDVSIGFAWRGSVMAHAARDPYWQASVRREVTEHAVAAAAIENECSRCHMPMHNVAAQAAGRMAQVFANLGRKASKDSAASAQDGVSCSVCHQIEADKLGTPESFVGHFVVDTSGKQPRKAIGPYEVDPKLARFMRSATDFYPSQAAHIRSSELCATCHTLYTEALDPNGKPLGRFPEQVPYLEWRESGYRDGPTCAGCHMPEVEGAVHIANLLAEPRSGVGRHDFLAGNFLLPAMLEHLGVASPALPQDFERARAKTRGFLADQAAKLSIGAVRVDDGRLETEIAVENLTGHKLPTAYPSRRAWLHVIVKDAAGQVVFESGAIGTDGKITGNDNDEDPARFEPHHQVIEKADQVQIYEPILGDSQGRVTTGLLHAVKYLKDNRVVPAGFEKKGVPSDVAVHGAALADPDFDDGVDRVHLRIPVGQGKAPFGIEAELLYQPIGFRWAENVRSVPGAEPPRFSRAYDALAPVSFQRLARAQGAQVTPPATEAMPASP